MPVVIHCCDCPHAKALYFHVYCKADSEVRNLPYSIGHCLRVPHIQQEPPEWCPLLLADSSPPPEQAMASASTRPD
jgi:hypothetical protein